MKIIRKSVFCAQCTECGIFGSFTGLDTDRHNAAILAINAGWVEEEGETLCPACIEKRKGIKQLSFFDGAAA